MKKNEKITICINDIDIKGKAYATLEGYKVYPNINAAPNQLVTGIITKKKHKKIFLSYCEILENNRKNQVFTGLKNAPGCNYQYYTYEEQLKKKNSLLEGLLKKVSDKIYIEDPIPSVDILGYRNKMEFSFGNEKINYPMQLGLHKQNSIYDVINVEGLKIMDENFNTIYVFLDNFFKEYEKDVTFYNKKTLKGYFRNVVIRKAENTKQIMINIVTTSQIEKKLEQQMFESLKDEVLKLNLNEFKISSLIHTVNDSLSDTIKMDHEKIIYGTRDIQEKILGLTFNISPYSFFQTNTKTTERLYEKVLNYLKDVKNKKSLNVFDLFSGTGTIAQILSKEFSKIYAIEINEEASKKAIENAKINNIENIEFLCGDVFVKLDELKMSVDVIVVDPPRQGLLTKTIEKLVKYNTKTIIYVSCNPLTLVKDLEDFKEHGYTAKKACMVDMYPFTKHVETVALLSKLDVDKHISVKIELDELDLTSA